MTTISTRFSEKELDYLSRIARDNKITKGTSNELSLGKAVKEIIKWCQRNKIDINESSNAMDSDIKKMIEQIHVTLPNLMYLTRLQLLLKSDEIPDEEVSKCVKKTLEYLEQSCGDFQNINYNEIRFSMNEFGIKQIPINEDKSLWKYR